MSGCNARNEDEESSLRTKTNTLDSRVERVKEAGP